MTSAPNALQQGEAYAAMLTNNPGLSIRQLAADLGCDERFVTRRLQLLQLIPELQQALHAGRLSYTQARQLAPLSFGQQLRAARNVRPPAAPTQTNREAARARRGANALRQGETYAAMLANNPGRTIHQLAIDLGLHPIYVTRRLRLLSLIPELQKALCEGRLSYSRAWPLSQASTSEQQCVARALSGASATATPDGRPTGRTTTHHLETA